MKPRAAENVTIAAWAAILAAGLVMWATLGWLALTLWRLG